MKGELHRTTAYRCVVDRGGMGKKERGREEGGREEGGGKGEGETHCV